jgi:hypothetical protein
MATRAGFGPVPPRAADLDWRAAPPDALRDLLAIHKRYRLPIDVSETGQQRPPSGTKCQRSVAHRVSPLTAPPD